MAARQQLLDEVAGDEWWIDVTLPMLELVVSGIRVLVRLVEKSKRAVVSPTSRTSLAKGLFAVDGERRVVAR